MKCIEAQQLVKPYIKKQLSDKQLECFLDHVENCKECFDELEIYFTIYQTLEDSGEDQGTEQYDFTEKLQQDIRNARRYLTLRKAYRIFRFAILLVAELLLVCTIITGVEMQGEQGRQGTTWYRVTHGNYGMGLFPKKDAEEIMKDQLAQQHYEAELEKRQTEQESTQTERESAQTEQKSTQKEKTGNSSEN